jgi:hypothetical protein
MAADKQNPQSPSENEDFDLFENNGAASAVAVLDNDDADGFKKEHKAHEEFETDHNPFEYVYTDAARDDDTNRHNANLDQSFAKGSNNESDGLTEEEKKKKEERERAFEMALANAAATARESAKIMNDLADAIAEHKQSHKQHMTEIGTGAKVLDSMAAKDQAQANAARNYFKKGSLDLNEITDIDKKAMGLNGTHYMIARDLRTHEIFIFDDQGNKKQLDPDQTKAVEDYLKAHPNRRVIGYDGKNTKVFSYMKSFHEHQDRTDIEKGLSAEIKSYKANDGAAKIISDAEPLLKKYDDPEARKTMTPQEINIAKAAKLLLEHEHDLADAIKDPTNMSPEQMRHHREIIQASYALQAHIKAGTVTPEILDAAQKTFVANGAQRQTATTNATTEESREAPSLKPDLNLALIKQELANMVSLILAEHKGKPTDDELKRIMSGVGVPEKYVEQVKNELLKENPQLQLEGRVNTNNAPEIAPQTFNNNPTNQPPSPSNQMRL